MIKTHLTMIKTLLGDSGHSSVQFCKHKADQDCKQQGWQHLLAVAVVAIILLGTAVGLLVGVPGSLATGAA